MKVKKYIKEYREITLVVILFFLQLFFLKLSFFIESYHFLFLFFFFNIILVPGYLLSKTIFDDLSLPGYALFTFVFGTAVTFLVLMIFALFHLDIFFIGIVMPSLSLILALLRKINPSILANAGRAQFELPGISKRSRIILFLLLIFVTILIISHGDPLL